MEIRKGFAGDAIVSVSAANICFLKVWFDLLKRSPADYYFSDILPVQANFIGLLINVALLALIVFSFLQMRRFFHDNKAARCLGSWAVIVPFVIGLNGIRTQYWAPVLSQFGKNGSKAFFALFAIVIAVLVLKHSRLYQMVRSCLMILSPFILSTLVQAFMLAKDADGFLAAKNFAVPSEVSQAPEHRVVVLVYDEMDYRITFVDRPSWLLLPELDRLKRESFFATNAHAPTESTMTSLPSLIVGKEVASARPSDFDELSLIFRDGSSGDWSTIPNMFSRAKSFGYNTALVGSYHPYCRVLENDLTYCASYPDHSIGVGGAMAMQWFRLFPFLNRHVHQDRYRFIQAQSEIVAADKRFGLVFIHLPVPHGPPIFNAERDAFSLFGNTVTDNVNNLKLADYSLGAIRRAMEASDVWDSSTVIVTADHSWRTSATYDGKKDARVPFMVKHVSRRTGLCYDNFFATIDFFSELPLTTRLDTF